MSTSPRELAARRTRAHGVRLLALIGLLVISGFLPGWTA